LASDASKTGTFFHSGICFSKIHILMINLNSQQRKARKVLIEVAKGDLIIRNPGLISYKDLWDRVVGAGWARDKTKAVVGWITEISAFEALNGRPPLNEIVVRKDKREPLEPWSNVKKHIEKKFSVSLDYGSHFEAQAACWQYWGSQDQGERKKLSDEAVEEAVQQDRNLTFRKRNAAIIKKRKAFDHYSCKSCGFHLRLNGKYVIECHHIHPLGLISDVTVTRLEDLVCLCPTCHRIAHTRYFPLSLAEIRAALRGR
jgi:predicted HNH restriction endonuclease